MFLRHLERVSLLPRYDLVEDVVVLEHHHLRDGAAAAVVAEVAVRGRLVAPGHGADAERERGLAIPIHDGRLASLLRVAEAVRPAERDGHENSRRRSRRRDPELDQCLPADDLPMLGELGVEASVIERCEALRVLSHALREGVFAVAAVEDRGIRAGGGDQLRLLALAAVRAAREDRRHRGLGIAKLRGTFALGRSRTAYALVLALTRFLPRAFVALRELRLGQRCGARASCAIGVRRGDGKALRGHVRLFIGGAVPQVLPGVPIGDDRLAGRGRIDWPDVGRCRGRVTCWDVSISSCGGSRRGRHVMSWGVSTSSCGDRRGRGVLCWRRLFSMSSRLVRGVKCWGRRVVARRSRPCGGGRCRPFGDLVLVLRILVVAGASVGASGLRSGHRGVLALQPLFESLDPFAEGLGFAGALARDGVADGLVRGVLDDGDDEAWPKLAAPAATERRRVHRAEQRGGKKCARHVVKEMKGFSTTVQSQLECTKRGNQTVFPIT